MSERFFDPDPKYTERKNKLYAEIMIEEAIKTDGEAVTNRSLGDYNYHVGISYRQHNQKALSELFLQIAENFYADAKQLHNGELPNPPKFDPKRYKDN